MSTPHQPWYSLGPHAFYDLVRLARRGRSTLVRVLYILALFAALAATYYNTVREHDRFNLRDPFIESINRNALIAERFSITILVAQNVAVLVLMPIYIGASIQEERDRRTLALLFTTHLSAWDIVVGKWLSRVGHVGVVLLSGLPVLAFAQLWGGIDMPMIAANFLNTGMLLCTVGALSMVIAIQSQSLLGSLTKTYAALAAGCFCCCVPMELSQGKSVFLLMPWRDSDAAYVAMFNMAGLMTFVYGLVAFMLLTGAARLLEAQRGHEPAPEVIIEPGETTPFHSAFSARPEVGANAVVWMERHTQRPIWFDAPILLLPLILWILALGLSMFHAENTPPLRHAQEHQQVLRFLLHVSAGVFLLIVAFRLTGCIVRERQQQTLDALLTLPLTPRELLYAKLWGNLARHWTWLVPLAVCWLGVMIFGSGYRLAAVGFLFVLAVHLYFIAMLSLFLSVTCRTTVSAYVSLAVILSALLIGPLFLAEFAGLRHIDVFSPVVAWTTIWDRSPARPEEFVSVGLYLTGAAVLDRLTFALFGQHASRTV